MNHRPIKVLHVINSLEIGGAETLLVNFAKRFNDSTFEIVIAYFIGKCTLVKEQGLHCRIYDLSKNGNFSWFSFYKLICIIKKEKVKILHTHDPQSGIIGRLAAFVCGIRLIVTTRHTPVLIGNHPVIYRIENYLLGKSTFIIAISKAVRQKLIEENIVHLNKILLIYNGVDINYFSSKQHIGGAGKAKGQIIIGSVGRMTELKGHDILISAIELLSKRKDNFKLHIVGSGSEETKLRNLIDSLELYEIVKLHGKLNQDEVKIFFEEIDIFVQTSRSEGFGMSIVEAMSMSKPVIASRVGGVVEIINDGEDGLLFRPGDAAELSEKLYLLIENEQLRNKLGANARKRVENQFSLEAFINRTAHLYKTLITEVPE